MGQHGLEGGMSQKRQDGGRSSLGVTDGRVYYQCRTDFRVPRYARERFDPITSVESGFLANMWSGVPRGEGLALVVAAGEKVGSRRCTGVVLGEHGLE